MSQLTLVILTDSKNGYAGLSGIREDLAAQTHQPDQVLVMVADDSAPPILPTDYVVMGKNSKVAQRGVSLAYCKFMPMFWDDAKRYPADFIERFVSATENRKVKHKSLMQKVKSLISAVTGPRATEETYQKRLAICEACPKLKRKNDKLFCGACGCGKWKLAELHTKLKFADLECPLDPPKWVQEPKVAG